MDICYLQVDCFPVMSTSLGAYAAATAAIIGWRLLYSGVLAILLIALYHEYLRWATHIRGLPGPRGLPIIGNLLQVRGKPAYEIYRKWAKEYGPVFQGESGTPVMSAIH